MTQSYQTRGQDYVLLDGNQQLGQPMREVALALDSRNGSLLKHGDAASVRAWYAVATARLRAGLSDDAARATVVICGRFPLDELNRCLAQNGYAGTLLAQLRAGHVDALPAR